MILVLAVEVPECGDRGVPTLEVYQVPPGFEADIVSIAPRTLQYWTKDWLRLHVNRNTKIIEGQSVLFRTILPDTDP